MELNITHHIISHHSQSDVLWETGALTKQSLFLSFLKPTVFNLQICIDMNSQVRPRRKDNTSPMFQD